MVEAVSTKFICIVDESKLSSKGLGPNFPLPVEITPFCHEHTRRVIEGLPSLKGNQLDFGGWCTTTRKFPSYK